MSSNKIKLIILDRDGVVNYDSDNYIKSVDEFVPLPGSLAAIARINRAGIPVVIATNQSGIARGYYDIETLAAMHDKLARLLAELGGHVEKIYYCPHGPDDYCDCRKPKPGMLVQALQDFQVAAQDALLIGDSIRDLEAAEAVHVRHVLVKTGKGQQSLEKIQAQGRYADVPVFDDLASAIQEILEH